MTDEVRFAVTSRKKWVGGRWVKVHVIDPVKGPHDFGSAWGENRPFIFGWVGTTYCGREILTHARPGAGEIGEFFDEAMCLQCYRAFPGPKEKLFEHEVPEEPWLS